jgi:hypothetical protein
MLIKYVEVHRRDFDSLGFSGKFEEERWPHSGNRVVSGLFLGAQKVSEIIGISYGVSALKTNDFRSS